MSNFIATTIHKVTSLLNQLFAKKILPTVLVALLLLTTNLATAYSTQEVSKKLDTVVHQDDSQRPKTTGEWNQEARETKNAPAERLKRIGKQSAEAVKDFGAVYPDTAKRSASELKNNSKARG